MEVRWPSERESLRAKVEAYRDLSVEERVRAVGRLFEFFRLLMRNPERRRKWEAARRSMEEEARDSFRRLLRPEPHA